MGGGKKTGEHWGSSAVTQKTWEENAAIVRQFGGAVGSCIAASHLQDPCFDPELKFLSTLKFHMFSLVTLWVSSGFCGFLSLLKNMPVG